MEYGKKNGKRAEKFYRKDSVKGNETLGEKRK